MGLLDDVDWVTARAGCTVQKMLLKIKEEILRDVATRNALRTHQAEYAFHVQDDGAAFTVSLAWNKATRFVTFRCDGDRLIAVDQHGKEVAEAKVTMTQAAMCGLALPNSDGRASETWEFRFKALEHLFFVAPNEK